jgi:hypothetical protein
MPDETPVVGLTDSELERLPTMIYTKFCTDIATDDKCAVCLSEYIMGEKLKHLRCKHFFHSECIDPWLKVIFFFNFFVKQFYIFCFRHQRDVRSVEVNRQVE